jgi:two-component system sensor histidine kinase KdpD
MIKSSEFLTTVNPKLIGKNQVSLRRGKHKIFIGMSPGVGKTYRILEEGKIIKQDGIDVVIGLLETHGREDTANQAMGLELIPRKTVVFSDRSLTEMDTDAIIKREPQLMCIQRLIFNISKV